MLGSGAAFVDQVSQGEGAAFRGAGGLGEFLLVALPARLAWILHNSIQSSRIQGGWCGAFSSEEFVPAFFRATEAGTLGYTNYSACTLEKQNKSQTSRVFFFPGEGEEWSMNW